MAVGLDELFKLKKELLKKYPRFGSEIAKAKIEFTSCKTACTDGKNIFFDPNFFESLSQEERLFTLAHELMHIKFMHMYRLRDKDGNKKDFKLWNIATDAIINANLKRDGFKIKEGFINMPEALDYTAEEFYQKLLQEKKEQKTEQKQDGQSQNDQNQDDNQNSVEKQNKQNDNQQTEQSEQQGDDHSIWEDVFNNYENLEKEQKNDSQKQQNKSKDYGQEQQQSSFDEKSEFEENRQEKIEKFEARKKKALQDITTKTEEKIDLGDVGKSKEEIDWKVLLRREIEKTETIWSQRRSIAENNFAYRLEENDIEDEAETEVMIDVSGSVNLDLVKAFLRQLKPIIKQSKLKVGCFNESFWGMKDIKSVRDIDNYTIPREARGRSAWTEDWDLAVRSFTKRKEINKIVFTDGYPCPGTMPKEDLKKENVIWLVYGNNKFKPCCGTVINITKKQLEKLQIINHETKDISR